MCAGDQRVVLSKQLSTMNRWHKQGCRVNVELFLKQGSCVCTRCLIGMVVCSNIFVWLLQLRMLSTRSNPEAFVVTVTLHVSSFHSA